MKRIIISLVALFAVALSCQLQAVAQTTGQLPPTDGRQGPTALKAVPTEARISDGLPKQVKTAAKTTAADASMFTGRTFYGALINSDTWANASITDVPYGIYSFEISDNPTPVSHITNLSYGFMSGAYGNEQFVGISALNVMGALNGARYITIDTRNWTELKNVLYDTSSKSYSLLPSAMAYNVTDNTIYSLQYNDDLSGLDWCVYNRDYDEMDKIASFRGRYNVITLASLPSGEMYFINNYGDLYTIDKANGRPRMVGFTGVEPVLYSQSMMYDGRTGLFLWAAWTTQGSQLYAVDPETAESFKVLDFKNNEQFVALYDTDNAAPDAAPAAVENLKITPDTDGGLGCTISFDVPNTTYGGNPLGKSTLNVWLDGQNLKGVDAVAGEHVSIPVTLTEGNHYVAVNLSNDGGYSPTVSLTKYIGYDVPKTVGSLTFTHDETAGTNNVSWTAPEGGVNAGYIDFNNLTYTVVRMPDSVTVATGLKATTFSEPTPTAMHSYSYRVMAVNNGKTGDYAESESILCGDAFTVPYEQAFADPSVLTDFFTIVDANKDNNTWRQGFNNDVRIDISVNNPIGDDWLITPGINMEGGTVYRFTMNMKTFTQGYPEDFDICVGTDPNDISTFKVAKEVRGLELYETFGDYSADFNIDADGEYFVAIRYCSDNANKGSMLMLNSVRVTKVGATKAPAAVGDLKITPDADGAMAATVAFTAPATDLAGDAIPSLTKVNVYRGGTAEPIHTFDSPAPGASLSFTDNRVSRVGTTVYSVVAENEYGAGATAADSAFVGIYSAPYLETFDTRAASELYTSLASGFDTEANPYYRWTYNEANKRMGFYAFNANEGDQANFWLFTPAMKLDANSVYAFSYKANINLYSNTITNKVYIGTDATPESQETFIGDMPSSTNYQMMETSHNVVTTEAGRFVFGFNSIGTSQGDYLSVDLDDVALTYLKSAFSPYMITDYNAEADKGGEMTVNMSFRVPDTDYQGNPLEGYLSVEVFRGTSPTPVFTKNDVAPGAVVEWSDTQAQHGQNIYMISASNSYGRSEVLADTLFVGRDVPETVGNYTAKGSADNQDAVLAWTAPTQGVNGGVVVADELTYNIYSYNISTNALTPIARNVEGTTYTVENEPSDAQRVLYYAVSAVNTEGESQAMAASVTLGKPYTLPFKESFAGKELSTTPWTEVTSNDYVLNWNLDNPDGSTYNGAVAQDGDGGVAYMYNGSMYETFAGAGFVSPKVSLGGTTATLSFWVYNMATNYPDNKPLLDVYVRADDGEMEQVGSYIVGGDTEEGWKLYEIPLTDYASSGNISFAFYGYTGGYMDVIYLDNIEIKAGLPSSIDGVDAQGKEIESESWYTVDGMKVEKPRGGLFIHTVRYTDGTVKTDKVVVE